jgi:hypothetical protein
VNTAASFLIKPASVAWGDNSLGIQCWGDNAQFDGEWVYNGISYSDDNDFEDFTLLWAFNPSSVSVPSVQVQINSSSTDYSANEPANYVVSWRSSNISSCMGAGGLSGQTQFDPEILFSSRSTQLPPRVVKAVIAVESQFWPAADWTLGEIGLGQMTGYGADLVLMWRPEYFQGICRRVFGDKGCISTYPSLDPSTQYLLRGMVLKDIDAPCSDCSGGINIEKGRQTVWVLAETINASCLQSARMIYLGTGKIPSQILSYEDYWRLVLANYQAGAGCVYQALRRTTNQNNWNSIAANFSSGCASGAEYIRRIEEQVKL